MEEFDLNLLLRGDYNLLKAPTGSGKTSTIPIRCIREKGMKTVFCVFPTIISVTSMEQRIKTYGITIGSARDREISYTNTELGIGEGRNDTQIVLCTLPHMVSRLIDLSFRQTKKFADLVILDEWHQDSHEVDAFISLFLNLKMKPKLLLMSATTNPSRLSFFFPEGVNEMNIDRRIGHMVVQSYEGKSYGLRDQTMLRDLANRVIRYNKTYPGTTTWLVFLPGIGEINDVKTKLEGIDATIAVLCGKRRDIIPQGDKRIIYLATNVIETSVTIKNVTGVFDSMLERVPDVGGKLVIRKIGPSSAEQRKGRVGRESAGFCHRMCEKAPEELPSVVRFPPQTLLRLIGAGIDTSKLPGVHPMFELQKSGHIRVDDQTKLTESIGMFGSIMHMMTPIESRMLWRWVNVRNLPPYVFIKMLADTKKDRIAFGKMVVEAYSQIETISVGRFDIEKARELFNQKPYEGRFMKVEGTLEY
mgnify:CR=1 FL=1